MKPALRFQAIGCFVPKVTLVLPSLSGPSVNMLACRYVDYVLFWVVGPFVSGNWKFVLFSFVWVHSLYMSEIILLVLISFTKVRRGGDKTSTKRDITASSLQFLCHLLSVDPD